MAATETRATTLFSLDVVRNYVGANDATLDDLIVRIADAVSERIEMQTNRVFVTRTIVETLNGDGSRRLVLRFCPIVAVASLTMKYTADQATPDALVEGTDYDIDKRIGKIMLRTLTFPEVFQGVVCTYSTGFGAKDAATLPADLYEAALEYVKYLYSIKTANAVAATSVSLGNSTFMLTQDLPADLKRAINYWRVPSIS